MLRIISAHDPRYGTSNTTWVNSIENPPLPGGERGTRQGCNFRWGSPGTPYGTAGECVATMIDPILILFILFHTWEAITHAWTWWKWTNPDKKTFVKDDVGEDSREPVLSSN